MEFVSINHMVLRPAKESRGTDAGSKPSSKTPSPKDVNKIKKNSPDINSGINQNDTNETDSPPVVIPAKDLKRIGDWGEGFVYMKLKHLYQSKYSACVLTETEDGFLLKKEDELGLSFTLHVIWHNRTTESGKSKDLTIIKNGIKRCIEVKTTQSNKASELRLTRSECDKMRKFGNRYRIFRVYGAGTRQAKILKIKDPAKKIDDGQLKFMAISYKL